MLRRPLATPALTRASLAAAGAATDDVEAWLEALAPDEDGRAAFDLLTAVSCLDIAREHLPTPDHRTGTDDADRLERLTALATSLVASSG